MRFETPPEPAGFGNCASCAFVRSGPPHVCQQCAAKTFEVPAPYYCTVCGQRILTASGICSNGLCSDPQRYFEFNQAIALKTGQLQSAIWAHKYNQAWGWGQIFARVVLGHLAQHPEVGDVDLIIPMPSLPLPPGVTSRAGYDHAGWVIESAIAQDLTGFPLRADPPVAVKLTETPKMARTSSLAERRMTAAQIYRSVQVADPAAIQGATITVVDDVFTSGSTLNAVARRLLEGGAAKVRGLTLARQPWG